MSDTLQVKNATIMLVKEDITDIEIDSFVYYARHDLALGSGFGTAISVRGGPSIQSELNDLKPLQTTEAVVSGAGNLKAKYIIHSVGPRFQEVDIENKLRVTVENALRQAEAKGLSSIAFPPMGTGFYGVPLDLSARVTLKTIAEHLKKDTSLKLVKICLMDNREFIPFQKCLTTLGQE
jgi:O-acetyl-ADP-ribose deacetylase (regulator of RNase III)